MKVTERYDLSIDTGETDGEGNPIYESVPHLEETVADGKQLKRVGNKNHTQSYNLKEDSSVDLYQDDQLLATWQIIPQYWHIDEWRDYIKVVDLLSIIDGHLVASGEQGGFSWNIDIAWTSNDSKWEINVVAPGFLFRFKWNIVFTELGQSLIVDGTLNLGYEDYIGETQDDEGIVERNIIFEPDGVNDFLVVDPYLSLKEESTFIYVYCDGYHLKISKEDTISWVNLFSTSDVPYWGFVTSVTVGGTLYYISYDESRIVTILENTPLRVVIKSTGNFESVAGVTLTNSKELQFYLFIYSDRIYSHFIWEIETSSITLDNTNTGNRTVGVVLDGAVLDNERTFREVSGSEVYSSSNVYSGSNYAASLSNQLNYALVISDQDLPEDEYLYVNGLARIYTGWMNRVMSIGTYEMKINTIFDFVDREEITPTTAWTDTDFSVGDLVVNDSVGWECISTVTSGNSAVTEPGTGSGWTTYWIQCHKYTSTDRLAMGEQYHGITSNTDLIDIVDSKGSFVTDLNIPKTIDSSEAFASDGAYHLDTIDNEAKIIFNQIEEKPVIVLHDPSIRTGDGTTEHLVEHFVFSDNATSSTIVAATGNNATWEDSSGTGRNTDNDNITTNIFRGSGLDTKDTYHVDIVTTVYANAVFLEGTIILQFTPQFNYDDAADQTLFILYVDSDDYIQLVYDAGSDRYELRISWGGTLVTINDSAYTENTSLQQATTIQFAWDSDKDFIALIVHSEIIVGINTGTPSTSAGAYIHIGADSDGDGTTSLNADVFLDQYKIYNACILPYGTFISAQHVNDDDYSDAHSDITFYWDGSDCTSTDVQIGGVQGTLGSNNTGGTASFVTTGGPAGTGYFDNESNDANYRIDFPVTNNDILIPEFCSISFWAYLPAWVVYERFMLILNSSRESIMWFSTATSENSIEFVIKNNSTGTFVVHGTGIPIASWFFTRINLNTANGGGQVYINGSLVSEITGYIGTLDTAAYVATGTIDAYMYGLTITNNPNTPELPFVLGHGPVVTPKLYES